MMDFPTFIWTIVILSLFIVIYKIIQLIVITIKNMIIKLINRDPPLPLKRFCKSDIKCGNCYRCNSEKIVAGKLGNGSRYIDPYFNPGYFKWYQELLFIICPGVDIENQAKCCIECGLVWTKLDIQSLMNFISSRCKDVFVREIYGGKNHSSVHSLQNRIMKTDNEEYCINCNSRIFITGRLFSYSGGRDRRVSYSVFFHPYHLKEYKLMTRRGVRINVSSVCCPVCGYIFTDTDQEKLIWFLDKNCNKNCYIHIMNP